MFPSTCDVKSNLTVAFASCLGLVFLDKYHHIKQIQIIIIIIIIIINRDISQEISGFTVHSLCHQRTTGSIMGTTGSVVGDHGECAWVPWGVSMGTTDNGECAWGPWGVCMGTIGSVHGDHGECAWGPRGVSWGPREESLEPWGVFKATK